MAQPFVGEIRMFAGNFAPVGWMFCDGSVLAISENETLFQLIGTTYGGDGQATFKLPDLRSRVPLHQGTLLGGNTYLLADSAGQEQVTLTAAQLPAHFHPVAASASPGHLSSPANALPAKHRDFNLFRGGVSSQPADIMSAQSVSPAGGNQPHNNMPPYLCVSFIIALFGIFPPRN
jgi:microcystin-dependent protein